MIDKIIDYIKKNRVSSTEIADCLGKRGLFENARALNGKHFKAGKIHYCYCDNESNWNLHKNIRDAEENSIVLVDDLGSNGRALFGDLVSKYLLLYRQVAGIVTNGNVRDAHTLVKENYPIWCNGTSPIGCFNVETEDKDLDRLMLEQRREYFSGSIAVCDDSGVVIIPKKNINADFLKKMEFIEEQEDIWFDCLDRRKWDTFDTVCLKKYKK